MTILPCPKTTLLVGLFCSTAALTLRASAQNDAIIFPSAARAVVDVTSAPYHADPTGQRDSTAALIRAIDDVMRADRDAMRATAQQYRTDPAALLNPELKDGNLWFPDTPSPARILYFPNGTYVVSDTVTYSLLDAQSGLAQDGSGGELNRMLHLVGQSRDGVIIRLADHSPGFETGAEKPVLSFMTGVKSAVAMNNSIENLTIDIGRGNPGAVGLRFFCNNTGLVRQIRVLSSDPDRRGHAGIALTDWNSSCAYLKNITVEGFDYGILVQKERLYSVMEHVALRDQRLAGIFLEDNNLVIRGLHSRNRVPALRLASHLAYACLVEADLAAPADTSEPAIDLRAGYLFARQVTTAGYSTAIRDHRRGLSTESSVSEFVSHLPERLFKNQRPSSLNLPVKETPAFAWPDPTAQPWALVDQFGAVGDGQHDDTDAIQRALDSGSATVAFQPGRYRLSRPLRIPATVTRLNFMYGDLAWTGDTEAHRDRGIFQIEANSASPLLIENLFAMGTFTGPHYFLEHASTRTVVLRSLHVQMMRLYRNSVPGGEVFIENVASTNGRVFGTGTNHQPCFSFTGQTVWARQLNPERAHPTVVNDGGSLWVLGFKTEGDYTSFLTRHQGSTEILGGILNYFRGRTKGDNHPNIVNDHSSVSVTCSTTDPRVGNSFDTQGQALVSEIQLGLTRNLTFNALPRREDHLVVIPLYVGRHQQNRDGQD